LSGLVSAAERALIADASQRKVDVLNMLVDETIAEGRDPLSDPQVQSSLYRAESWGIMAHSGGVWAGPIEAIRARSVTTALAECDVIAEELGLTGQEAAELLIRVRGYLDGCGNP